MSKNNRLPSFGWKMQRAQNAANVGEIWIYDDIVAYESWWDEGGITPKKFKEDLDALGEVNEIKVYINSNGGDVFAGQAIHTMLARHKATVTVYIDGLAASIASVIAMAGDKVIIAANAEMMIHNPWTAIWDWLAGNADYFRDMAEKFTKLANDLDVIRESLIAAYMKRCKVSKEELVAMLDAETWLPAERCVELGLADEIEAGKQVAACLRGDILAMNGKEFDLSRFHNRPQIETVAELPTPTPIVKDELPHAYGREVDGRVIVVVDGKDVAQFTITDEMRSIFAKGRTISAETESSIRAVYDGLGTHRDSLKAILDKVSGSDDGDADGAVPCDPDEDPNKEPDGPDDKCDPTKDALAGMALAEFKHDERIDALLAKVDALTAKVEALTPQNVVEPPVDKPSPQNNGEDDVITVQPDDSVIELDDAADEVDVEAETLKQTVKAALEEMKTELKAEAAEWRLQNLGKVD